MRVEITGVASKETRGMKTRVVFRLSSTPPKEWLDAFLHLTSVQVTSYPREMFQFEDDTVACEFLGLREPEAIETLQLYIADTNKQVVKAATARKAATNPRFAKRQVEAKKRQTMMLNRELFGDEPDAEDPDAPE